MPYLLWICYIENILKNFTENAAQILQKNIPENAAQILDDLTTPTQRHRIFAPPPPHSTTLSSKFKTTQHCYTHPRNTVEMVTHLLCISYKFNTVVACVLQYVALYVGMRYAYLTHCNINLGVDNGAINICRTVQHHLSNRLRGLQ